jgi:hypothetical protein
MAIRRVTTWVQTHCRHGYGQIHGRRGSRPTAGVGLVVVLRCIGLSLVVGLPAWVYGRGSLVRGCFFGCLFGFIW